MNVVAYCICIPYAVPIAANTLSFEATRVDVNESDGAVQVCVHRTGRVRRFRLYTTAINAQGMIGDMQQGTVP